MPNQKSALTPAAIKYLLTISTLCKDGRGARNVDIAAKLNVSKPSTHHMLQILCDAGLAERERYGLVYLTERGRSAANAYGDCYERLCTKLKDALGLDDAICRSAAFAVLEQLPGQLSELGDLSDAAV